jgi:hypothetical protein
MDLRDDFMRDWSAAGDNASRRKAVLTHGFDTLESRGVDVTFRRSRLADAHVDRWRAQFDASRWIDEGLAGLDEST